MQYCHLHETPLLQFVQTVDSCHELGRKHTLCTSACIISPRPSQNACCTRECIQKSSGLCWHQLAKTSHAAHIFVDSTLKGFYSSLAHACTAVCRYLELGVAQVHKHCSDAMLWQWLWEMEWGMMCDLGMRV